MAVAEKAEASLGGKPLDATEPISWTLRAGVEPATGTFLMVPSDALEIAGKREPVTLEIYPTEGAPVIVTNLWVLTIMPGPNPNLVRVNVADRRWFWPHAHVERHYNVLRATGVKRIINNVEGLKGLPDRAAALAYARYSASPAQWIAQTVVTDVLSDVARIESGYWGQTFTAVLDQRIIDSSRNLPIQELHVEDPGDAAVNRVLVVLPEAEITVDYDGSVVVFSRAAGDEIQIAAAVQPEVWGHGHSALVDHSIIRPKEIHVLFTRKVEVRFDFIEEAAVAVATGVSSPNATVTADTNISVDDEPLRFKRQMINVLDVPDYAMDGASGRPAQINGRTLPQGMWVGFDDYMKACPPVTIGGLVQKIDHRFLQRAFVPQMDLWSALGLVGIFPDSKGNLQNWVGRIGCFKKNYRQTFQLNRLWTDNFLSWEPERVATINPQTGQRGPSSWWGDFFILASQRTHIRSLALGEKDLPFGINKSAYSGGNLDETAFVSPALVEQLDMDQGVLRVNYLMDMMQSYEQVLPSQMVGDSIPSANLTHPTRPIAFNAILHATNAPRLSPSFMAATIITAVPASPNNNQQLHRVVVKPSDVIDLVPDAAKASLGKCEGPIMEIRIGAGQEVARIRWSDNADDKKTIEHIFGIDADTGQQWSVPQNTDAQAAFSDAVAKLCINQQTTSPQSGGSLNNIARARAASIWASLVDRQEGNFTGGMNGNVSLSGYTQEITHEYTSKAQTYTRVSFPASVPQMSLFSFLSTSDRAVILKLVHA